MSRKILGSIGIAVGLGLAMYYFLFQGGSFKPPVPGPPGQTPVAGSPAPQAPQPPGVPAPQLPVTPEPTPPVPGPAAPPAVVPVPTPTQPPTEMTTSPSPPLEPKKEHALLAGRSSNYKDAKRLLEKIQKRQMPAVIRKEGKYYQVWAGPFPTPQEAERARKRLRAALKISPKTGKLEIPVAK